VAGVAAARTSAPAAPRVAALRGARSTDLALLFGSLALTAIAQPHLLAADTLISLDTATQYYPWYAYLGESLRAGHLPGWNPAVFSGAPFAANPLSGWTYLPAMLLFAALPLPVAVHAYLLFHAFFAAACTYVLGRVLGLSQVAALLSGVAYANSGFFDVQNVRSNPFASVYAWLPVALIGAELAARQSRLRGCIVWWGLAAFAMSQIIGVWPGQGAYYSAMLVGGYLAYRSLLCPADSHMPLRTRTLHLAIHGVAVFATAGALDAAAILPRLEFNTLSNLAGGYTGSEASVGGLNPKEWLLVAVPGYWYAGISVFVLVIAAALWSPRRFRPMVGFFGLTSIGALLISGRYETPLHWLLYRVLPGLGGIHPHAPERIMTVAYLGPALLAGVGLMAMEERGWRLSRIQLGPRARTLAPWLLVLLVAADLGFSGAKARADVMLTDVQNGADKLTPVNLMTYYEPDGAAQFLRRQVQSDGTPSRYIGYAPYLSNGTAWPYTTRFADPSTIALNVNNRALSVGLQDAEGYDASHLQRYDAYLAMLNGRTQNYHDGEVFWAGLQSPLLDLLNVRYVIVPPAERVDVSDTAALERFSPTVYSDGRVRILENPSALPRAWIVHSATQSTASDALAAIDSGRVLARSTALLEEPPPGLAAPTDRASDRAEVTLDSADRVAITTSTTAPSMLILSEVYYPAWRAYVDNHPVHVYVADAALRAVELPAGDHEVEFRFESLSLVVGCAISAATAIAVGILVLVSRFASRRSC
jgi:hypothetical protein